MKRIGITILASVALMGALLIGEATAHKAKFDTSVSVKYNKPDKKDPYAVANFEGALNSAKQRCVKNRTVTLYKREANGTTTVVGTDVTDLNGAWEIQPPSVTPGTYFAQAKKKVLRKNRKHRHVCKAGVSKDLSVK